MNAASQVRLARGSIVAACVMTLVTLAACEQEKRVVYSRSFLGGISGDRTGTADFDNRNGQAASATEQKTIIDNPDGTKTLLARNPKHLMNHIFYTLREDKADLFVSQVLSKRTRDEYSARGLDPKLAFEELKSRQKDMLDLFKAMPMANQTPGVFIENIGDGVMRMNAEQRIAMDLNWKGIDMVMERGNYKLLWFVGK
jgi:hypothetical protein